MCPENMTELASLGCREDSVLVGSGAVYRRLMDHDLGSGTGVPGYDFEKHILKKSTVGRPRLEKSESEDSGVELPPHSPCGSEKSYSNEERESIDLSCPEEAEHPSASPCKDSFTGDSSSEDADGLDIPAPLKVEKVKLHRYGEETVQREVPGVHHKLEQAVLRSRRQRLSSRELTQSRAKWGNRQYLGSLKDQRRGKTLYQRAKSPTRSLPESQDRDPLHLPGEGLLYLENLCGMLEQIAELQKKNQKLQREKRQAEERLHNRVMFVDSCQCSRAHPCRALQSDASGSTDTRTVKAQTYRKRAGSHAGIIRNLSQQPDNVLTAKAKTQPHFVSVPNLKENNSHSGDHTKTEVSQWEKVKDLIFKLSRKTSAGLAPARTGSSHRSSSLPDVPSNAPRRMFLPGLVIRPSRKQSQQHR